MARPLTARLSLSPSAGLLVALLLALASGAIAQTVVTVDDADANGVAFTGTWTTVADATAGQNGTSYRHDGNTGKGSAAASFTTTFTNAGDYAVYLRWPTGSGYANNVPVDIAHAGGTTTTTVDQTSSGGKWVLIGIHGYSIGVSYSVTIRNTGTSSHVVADAVRWVELGSGTIVDNVGPGFVSEDRSYTPPQSWTTSASVAGYYGSNYAHDGNTHKKQCSVYYSPSLPAAGAYAVEMRWRNSDTSLASAVPVTITYQSGDIDCSAYRTVDQQRNGGQWVPIGVFEFLEGTRAKLTIDNANTKGYVIADAVRWRKLPDEDTVNAIPPAEYIIDDAAASFEGTWAGDTAVAGFYDVGYRVYPSASTTALARFTPSIAAGRGGKYAVYFRWTASAANATNVPVVVTHANGTATGTDTVYVNQQASNGQWVLLGVFEFNVGTAGNVAVTANGVNGAVVADAVRFVQVSCNEAVVDNEDISGVTCDGPAHSGTDHTTAGCDWPASTSVSGYLGANYWSDGNAGKGGKWVGYRPALPADGTYAIYMRWTSHSTLRASNVPVDIRHTGGTRRVLVDQTTHGGEWRLLGTYGLSASAADPTVTIRNDGTSNTVVADALCFVRLDGTGDNHAAIPSLTVQISSPAHGASVLPSATLTLAATVGATGVTPTQVAFYQGEDLIGTDIDGTDGWACTWSTGSAGTRTVWAVVTDGTGGTATSPLATIYANTPPQASPQTVDATEDLPKPIVLGASDAETATLQYTYTQPPNGEVTGTAPNVTYTPDADFFGEDSFTFTVTDAGPGSGLQSTATVTVVVAPVNDTPVFSKGPNVAVLEDCGAQAIPGWATGISAGPANESGQSMMFFLMPSCSPPGLFAVMPDVALDGTLTFTPADNVSGSATISIGLQDNGGGAYWTALQTFTITVSPVNDAPAFAKGPDQTVLEDCGAQSMAGWATGITAGAPNESGQTLTFVVVSNTNPDLFAVSPAVATDGTLTFTPAANANGIATLALRIQDDGGALNGGCPTSATQEFTIAVTPVNDPPEFVVGASQTVLEDCGHQSVAGWATGITAGAPNEGGQTLTFVITGNTNPDLFAAGPGVAADGTLTFTPAANANGSATVTVRLEDGGGDLNGGCATSATQEFSISVTAVNDPPTFVLGADQMVVEDSPTTCVTGWATLMSPGPVDEVGQQLTFVVRVDHPELFALPVAIWSNGDLVFTPAPNAHGAATVTVVLTDGGDVTNGGRNASVGQTFSVVIQDINDAPVIALASPLACGSTNTPYVAPATVLLRAVASDVDGSIAAVRFYQVVPEPDPPVLLHTDVAAPFEYLWRNVAAGAYQVRAVAVDDDGAEAATLVTFVVNAGNTAPTVTLSAVPAAAGWVTQRAVTLTASAADADNGISRVEFYDGNVVIGEDAEAPYTMLWTPPTAGTFQLRARAIDAAGQATLSVATAVHIRNPAPTVTSVRRADGQPYPRFDGPSTWLEADAADGNGTVQVVRFYDRKDAYGEFRYLGEGERVDDDTWRYYLTDCPYPRHGSYYVVAIAVDDEGATSSVTNSGTKFYTEESVHRDFFFTLTDTATPPQEIPCAGTTGSGMFMYGLAVGDSVNVNLDILPGLWPAARRVQFRTTDGAEQTEAGHCVGGTRIGEDVVFAPVVGSNRGRATTQWQTPGIPGSYFVAFVVEEESGYRSVLGQYSPTTLCAGLPIRLITPGSTQRITLPSPFELQADVPRTFAARVARVRFWEGNQVVGTCSTPASVPDAPWYRFSASWSGQLTVGVHSIVAKAYDTADTEIAASVAACLYVSDSQTVTASPQVTCASDQQTYLPGEPVVLSMRTTNAAGEAAPVTGVAVYCGGLKLGDAQHVVDNLYTFTWSPAMEGGFQLYAEASEGGIGTILSGAVSVIVRSPAPTLAISQPDPAVASVAAGTVPVQTDAVGTCGAMAKIMIFANGVKMHESAGGQCVTTWQAAPGFTRLEVQAVDTDGRVSTYSAVKAVINPTPTLGLTAPATATAPGPIALTPVNLIDTNGPIRRVAFYADNVSTASRGPAQIGESSTAPYAFTWTNVLPGTYSVFARAYDEYGDFGDSPAQTVTVSDGPLAITITGPAAVVMPGTLRITATVTGGTLGYQSVVFSSNGQEIGEDRNGADGFSWDWLDVPAGTYQLTAVVTDSAQTQATAAAVTVRADAAPTVSLADDPATDEVDESQPATSEDKAVTLLFAITDLDAATANETLRLTVTTAPRNGALRDFGLGTNGRWKLVYTPNTDWHGTETLTVVASDGYATSAPLTVTIAVTPETDVWGAHPVADDVAVGGWEDTPLLIQLTASPGDCPTLTYTIVKQPAHATTPLVVDPVTHHVVYTPEADWCGTDSFRFIVTGTLTAGGVEHRVDSMSGVVTIEVQPQNDPPRITGPTSVRTMAGVYQTVTFTATDIDGDALTWNVGQPGGGEVVIVEETGYTLTISCTSVLPDIFWVTCDDRASGDMLEVYFDLAYENEPPTVPSGITVSGVEDTPLSITLQGTDVSGNISFVVVQPSADGQLGEINPDTHEVVFTPNANWSGTTTFTYEAHDGAEVSGPVTVVVTIEPANDNPTITVISPLTIDENQSVVVTPSASDIDPGTEELMFSIGAAPTHGTLGTIDSETGAVTYTPAFGWHSYTGVDPEPDSFTIVVSDGAGGYAEVEVVVTVSQVIQAVDIPIAEAFHGESEDAGTRMECAVPLAASAANGDPLTYWIVDLPQHGTLEWYNTEAPDQFMVPYDHETDPHASVLYVPERNWFGTDTFTFKAKNGDVESAPATVTVHTPLRRIDFETSIRTPVEVMLPAWATFTFGETAKAYACTDGGAQYADLAIGAQSLLLTPCWDTGGGVKTVTMHMSDGDGEHDIPVYIKINADTTPPKARDLSITVRPGTPKTFRLSTGPTASGSSAVTGFAVATLPIKGTVAFEPDHGTVTGDVEYTPTAGETGEDTFTYTATDVNGRTSNTATVTIYIVPLTGEGSGVSWHIYDDAGLEELPGATATGPNAPPASAIGHKVTVECLVRVAANQSLQAQPFSIRIAEDDAEGVHADAPIYRDCDPAWESATDPYVGPWTACSSITGTVTATTYYRCRIPWNTFDSHNGPHTISAIDENEAPFTFFTTDPGPARTSCTVKNMVFRPGSVTTSNPSAVGREDFVPYDPYSDNPAMRRPWVQFAFEDAVGPTTTSYTYYVCLRPTRATSWDDPGLCYVTDYGDPSASGDDSIRATWEGRTHPTALPDTAESNTYALDIFICEYDGGDRPADVIDLKSDSAFIEEHHVWEGTDEEGHPDLRCSYYIADSFGMALRELTLIPVDYALRVPESFTPNANLPCDPFTMHDGADHGGMIAYQPESSRSLAGWRAVMAGTEAVQDGVCRRDHVPKRTIAVNEMTATQAKNMVEGYAGEIIADEVIEKYGVRLWDGTYDNGGRPVMVDKTGWKPLYRASDRDCNAHGPDSVWYREVGPDVELLIVDNKAMRKTTISASDCKGLTDDFGNWAEIVMGYATRNIPDATLREKIRARLLIASQDLANANRRGVFRVVTNALGKSTNVSRPLWDAGVQFIEMSAHYTMDNYEKALKLIEGVTHKAIATAKAAVRTKIGKRAVGELLEAAAKKIGKKVPALQVLVYAPVALSYYQKYRDEGKSEADATNLAFVATAREALMDQFYLSDAEAGAKFLYEKLEQFVANLPYYRELRRWVDAPDLTGPED